MAWALALATHFLQNLGFGKNTASWQVNCPADGGGEGSFLAWVGRESDIQCPDFHARAHARAHTHTHTHTHTHAPSRCPSPGCKQPARGLQMHLVMCLPVWSLIRPLFLPRARQEAGRDFGHLCPAKAGPMGPVVGTEGEGPGHVAMKPRSSAHCGLCTPDTRSLLPRGSLPWALRGGAQAWVGQQGQARLASHLPRSQSQQGLGQEGGVAGVAGWVLM